MEKPTECYICKCTEENPCMTAEGPCSWSFETRKGSVCSACVVKLSPEPTREKYPNDFLLIEKVCINCAHLIKEQISGLDSYTCGNGHFGTYLDGAHHWFAWSGIKRPNKTVAEARPHCIDWSLHPRWLPKASV